MNIVSSFVLEFFLVITHKHVAFHTLATWKLSIDEKEISHIFVEMSGIDNY
mgnify:CR=1 FL=1